MLYYKHNLDVFRDKTILCPCDNPLKSNFPKFFIDNFKLFGLKKVISTNYFEENERELILEVEKEDIEKGIEFVYSKWKYLNGNGDFRS